MPDVHETPIAQALAALMHARNVRPAQLSERSGVAPNTIGYILNGTTPHPKRRTRQRLSRVLAEDPYTRELDRTIMAENERILAVAVGEATPTAQEIPTHLELCLYYRLASRERARLWVALIDRLEALPSESLLRIPSLLERDDATQDDSPDG